MKICREVSGECSCCLLSLRLRVCICVCLSISASVNVCICLPVSVYVECEFPTDAEVGGATGGEAAFLVGGASNGSVKKTFSKKNQLH